MDIHSLLQDPASADAARARRVQDSGKRLQAAAKLHAISETVRKKEALVLAAQQAAKKSSAQHRQALEAAEKVGANSAG